MYKYRERNLEEIIVLICLCILSMFVVVPQFKVYSLMTVAYMGIIAVLTLLMLRYAKNSEEWVYFLLATVFTVYTVIVPGLFGYGDLVNRHIALVPMVWMYVLYAYLNRNKAIKSAWYIMIFFGTITMLRTSKALISSPYISRMVKSSGEFSANVLRQGIGDYSFIYAIVLMSISFFWLFLERKGKKRIMYLLLTMVGGVTILLSNYMMALVLVGLGIMMLAAFWLYRKNKIVFVIAVIMLLIMLIFAKPILHAVLDSLLPIIPEGKTYDRLLQMQLSLYGEGKNLFEEFWIDRIPVLCISTESIKNYPWFGCVFGHLTKTDGYYNEFGQHSYVFDTMALYGVWSGVVLLILLSYPFFVNGRMKGRKKELSITMLVIMLILTIFNNVAFSMAMVLYVIYPYICDEGDKSYVK